MAIKRNKFDDVVDELNNQEEEDLQKNNAVLTKIAGTDTAHKKSKAPKEKRKTMPIYVPESLYKDFKEVAAEYGMSLNACICQAMREYLTFHNEKHAMREYLLRNKELLGIE